MGASFLEIFAKRLASDRRGVPRDQGGGSGDAGFTGQTSGTLAGSSRARRYGGGSAKPAAPCKCDGTRVPVLRGAGNGKRRGT
jgi:hypothetical protein